MKCLVDIINFNWASYCLRDLYRLAIYFSPFIFHTCVYFIFKLVFTIVQCRGLYFCVFDVGVT